MSFDVTRSRWAYEGILSTVRIDTLRAPDGAEFDREIIEHIDAVAVVPVTRTGVVVLLEQYRHPLRRSLLEIPAGVCDVDGEDPRETAVRELAEEVAMAADELVRLTRIHNSAGWTDESTVIYLATGAHPVRRPEGFTLEHEEAAMERVEIPLADAVADVRAGRITDAKTVVGLLLAAEQLG